MSAAAERTAAVAVDVTFLRMDRRPADPPLPLPLGARVTRATRCTTAFYRYLYDTVGHDYVWWLRRTLTEAELARILADPGVTIHVLYKDGEPAGFYELDRRNRPLVNLSYFGLMPHAIGAGLGRAFLGHAVDEAWSQGTRALTVNTCTADHPRALPNYLAAGFGKLRTVREVWNVPLHLGLPIPSRLRIG
ncbi:GNAT family N-acetyltransferase [Belnapia moabensis]|uniref:GNAT family N-acetyltransferase n=1 Tax=Belnapia moabensis TaxID=365533 RepID=UPI0005B80BEB|nr:GNAT family N-acetyltransferase [Belnapia moabensis]